MSDLNAMDIDVQPFVPPPTSQTPEERMTVETVTANVTTEVVSVLTTEAMEMAGDASVRLTPPGPPVEATGPDAMIIEETLTEETVPVTAPVAQEVLTPDIVSQPIASSSTQSHNVHSHVAETMLPVAVPNENGNVKSLPGRRPSPITQVLQPTAKLFGPAPGSQAESRPSSPVKIYRTGYVYDPLMMLHCQDGYTPTADNVTDAGKGHPEEPMRIKRIFGRLAASGLIKRMKKLEIRQARYDEVVLVHTDDHWNKVQGTETLSDQYIQDSKHYYDQLSLYVCRETAHCARLSCGGVIQACRAVCEGEVRNAFAIVRPPGHHAEPDEHMGFCFFNNVAVAAKEVMRAGLSKKVLILDWDVHHGNGTQRAFWDDPNVLYISIHRHDGGRFYPTSDFGALDMVGVGAGEGKTVNIPWPSAGFGDADYIYAFQKIVMPIAYEFAPDLVIISAGFDAAEGDSLGMCDVTPPAYGHMTHMLCALAGGKVVVALEGGYNLDAISRSSLAVAQVLLGETPAELGALEASEVATEVVYQVAKVQSKYWKSIDAKACEPPEVTDIDGESPVIPIPDLLKIHRAHHMFTKHHLYQIPLASPELEAAFAGQVICSEGVYEAGADSVLVVFVHDFGNLRVETDGITTTNVHLEHSYLLDTSDAIVNWVVGSGFRIIDVNVLRQLPTEFARQGPRMIAKTGPQPESQLIRYLWDNYIELSEAENVVLIGHGSGCGTVMELINHRDVERKVKAVVQVAGLHSVVRIDPENENRRDWFKKSNRIYVPSFHPLLSDERIKRRLGGQIFTSERAQVVSVLNDVLPQIKDFVLTKLSLPILPVPAPEPERMIPDSTTLVDGNAEAGPSVAPAILA